MMTKFVLTSVILERTRNENVQNYLISPSIHPLNIPLVFLGPIFDHFKNLTYFLPIQTIIQLYIGF